MFRLFFKTAFKQIENDKFHAFLNISGLALGLVAFLYITTYTFHELSFDKFHSKADRIYRCVAFAKMGESINQLATSEVSLATVAKIEFPEVEAAVRMHYEQNMIVRFADKKFVEKEIWYADANVFDVFDFTLIEGDSKTVLSKPNSIVLTNDAAEKYFGTRNPIGELLTLGDSKEIYQVTGILNRIPDNSHLQFEFLASFSTLPISSRTDAWGNFETTYTYLLLREGIDAEQFSQKFDATIKKYEEPMVQRTLGISFTEFEKRGDYFTHKLQPLKSIHLNSTFSEELKTYGNVRFLKILAITGILILVIACFNFINLSTSKSSLRAKEIGLKKIIGAARRTIIIQVLVEILLQCIIALVLAVLILLITLPLLNFYSETVIKPEYFLNPLALLTIIAIPLIITLLAGCYPAFYLTAFQPVEALKKKCNAGKSKFLARGSLATLQFVIFIGLVCSTIIIRKQIHFLQQQNPGFTKENVLIVKNTNYLGNNQTSFKQELLNSPSILSATFASTLPTIDEHAENPFSTKGSTQSIFMERVIVDSEFAKTLKVITLNGRFFSNNAEAESNNVVINEEAVRVFGWNDSEDKYIHDFNLDRDVKVIGIIKDFHLKSLREKSTPMVLTMANTSNYIAFRLQPGNLTSLVNTIRTKWEQLNIDAPFEYFFLDQAFDAQYKSEERLVKIIGVFTVIAISIACIGLFGLVSYTSNRKRKEIGVRKVNGARTTEVMAMLNRDFIKWVAIAFLIACPLAWYVMHKWLENFAYKTELSWWVFAGAGVIALVIALLTVSWQSWRAATKNPVESLRYE